jgi:diguanylate cyclase (GGDEF)-like protein/PAS domain S-box-containing protein
MQQRRTNIRSWATAGALLVLLVGTLITWGMVNHALTNAVQMARLQFEQDTNDVEGDIVNQMNQPQYGLGGLRSTIAALNHAPTVIEFQEAVRARDLKQEFPGVLGYGFLVPVVRADTQSFLTGAQADYNGNFAIKTAGTDNPMYVIRSIEPTEGNSAALGYDAGSEPYRRAAIEAAMRTGEMALSAPVHLMQVKGADLGVLYVAPARLPMKPGAPLAGFVYAAVNYPNEMSKLGAASLRLAFSMADVTDQPVVLFQSHQPSFSAIAAGSKFTEHRMISLGGRNFMLTTVSTPDFDATIKRQWAQWLALLGGVVSVVMSITTWLLIMRKERAMELAQNMTAGLAESQEMLRVTLNSIGDAVVTTDPEGRVVWMNPVAERLSAWTIPEARGKLITDIIRLFNDLPSQPVDPVGDAIRRGKIEVLAGNTVLTARQGAEYGVEITAAPIFDANSQVLGGVMVFKDVTKTRALNREMVHYARHDVLTGLPNRFEFEERTSHFIDRINGHGGQGAVMFIDLDHFKIVNDTCGHFSGDALLRQISEIIKSCVDKWDTVARLGGDEFAVLLEDCDETQARLVADDICETIDHYRFVAPSQKRFRVGASVGLTMAKSGGHSLDMLLHEADSACHAAKNAGRNRVHVWSLEDGGLQTQAGQTAWGVEVERALDDKSFELFAQRIEPRSERARQREAVEGASLEILLRMRLPDGGNSSPAAFMPAAERYQLATRIDRWVVREVFQRLSNERAWVERFGHIGVNLSGQSVGDPTFHTFVRDVISRATFDVRRVCFEITETAAITNLAAAAQFLSDMRERGIRIALDDFGSGVASFGYLKSLPVDYLKIDGQFVLGLTSNPIDKVSVQSFCDVARVLGVETIAEYVEDAQTLAILDLMGVDLAQGYFIHRPEPLNTFLAEHGLVAAPPAHVPSAEG